MIKITSQSTVTSVVIEPPVVLTDKLVAMGETIINGQYSVYRAVVEAYTYTDDEDDEPNVTLYGHRLSKAGKVRENSREIYVPTCYVTTRYPDGEVEFSSEQTDALKAAILKEVQAS